MRQPYQYEKKEKYTKTQHFISNNSNLPGKEVKTTIKSYKKEVTGNNENKNKGKYNNLQVSSTNQLKRENEEDKKENEEENKKEIENNKQKDKKDGKRLSFYEDIKLKEIRCHSITSF